MVTPEYQAHLDVHQLIASEEATLHGISNPALDRLDVLLGNGAARNLVFEDKPFARSRLDLDLHMPKLATAACLLLINFLTGRRLRNGLAIGDLRLADVGLNAKLTFHSIYDDLEM